MTHTGVDRNKWGWLDWLMFSQDLETLLNDFTKLPTYDDRPLTFMEIAGNPNYENVCSYILAFFLDPERGEGRFRRESLDGIEFLIPVAVHRTIKDGSSIMWNTHFVYENEWWRHHLTEEEKQIFRPDLSYKQFVEAQQ